MKPTDNNNLPYPDTENVYSATKLCGQDILKLQISNIKIMVVNKLKLILGKNL